MTNKQKATELDKKFRDMMFSPKEYHFTDCLLEMAQWKDEIFMEKAFRWFLENTQVNEPAVKYAPNGQPLAESWILREQARHHAARTLFESFKHYIES